MKSNSSQIYPSRVSNLFTGIVYLLTLALSFYFIFEYHDPSKWFVAAFLPVVVVITTIYATTTIILDEKGVSRHYTFWGRLIWEIQRIQYDDLERVDIHRDRHGIWIRISSPRNNWKDPLKPSAPCQILIPESQTRVKDLLVQLRHRLPTHKICPSVQTFLHKHGVESA
jgi:hypothetical protein